VPAAGGVDELRGDADAVAGPADRAFEYGLHAKFAADGAHVDRAAFVDEARIARDIFVKGNTAIDAVAFF